ncbi:DsbA family protein [Brevundimonas pondensis]|jgi:protein-disulfide isomerase|uniref:DsbA family protein n=1 Tax=Brevundimonas pondensis TaxID=2774189 RepID=A0ABX7SJ60_9CAUL|nr:DsbA family protein [Brevundimonas pondensis]QTC86840.1 DsbA family protein [Brevundimonas pondensis]
MLRKLAGAAALSVAMALAACSGKDAAPAEGDMALGAPEGAKVTVIEYASVTCSGCAAWNEQVWPQFKAKYVDTGKVRYVFREFPTPPQDVAVAGFLIARCAGEDKYFHVIDQIMRALPELHSGTPPRDILLRTARDAGLSEARFQTCISDPAGVAAMEKRIKAAQDAGVTGTPTFMVNGQVVGDRSLESLSQSIDPLLTAK